MASTQFKQLTDALLLAVDSALTPLGFAFKRSMQSYRRPTSLGWESCHLAFIKHSADVDVTLDVAIHVAAVQQLLHAHGSIKATKVADTATMGAEVGELSGTGQRRWTLVSDADVPGVAREIVHAVEAIALPFFEKYATLESALAALSNNDRTGPLYMPFHGERCRRAASLAFLLRDRARFDAVVESCRRFLQTRDDGDVASFDTFVKSLREQV